ncbi:Coiled-coil domain-containing protein 50 [Holothuria leucospilota]|uniref:Coiled-coil domain-containing protein 50 n=1 Tax=Holothuria leucospilota TaxID=206669 RepID=A0A9Q0YF18_HOLLE|nr:Coiled-coil domain-containing protein 50 [Holothuria leucospilota]
MGDVEKKFSVFEDGAYAHQVQEELNTEHYTGNISRRQTVRSDLIVAKSEAEREALEAFREEHEIAEKNRRIEEKDREAARKMYEKMMKEEREKAREKELEDMAIAKELQEHEKEKFILEKKKQMERENLQISEQLARSISQEERKKAERLKATESEDALVALSLEDKEFAINGVAPDVTDDEMIARQLQAHEKDKYLRAKQRHIEKKSEAVARRLAEEERERARRIQGRAAKAGGPPLSDLDGRHHPGARLNGQGDPTVRKVPGPEDDEMLARQILREEIQRARAPEQDEERLQREMRDAELARKMQREEVLLAKSRRHQRRLDAEIASPEDEPPYDRRDRTHRESEHHHNGDRYDPRHDQVRSREYYQDDRPREQRPPSTGQQHERVDPNLVERNPMVDAFPKAAESPRSQSNIQPIPGQKRQSTKEREKDKEKKEKDKKSKGFLRSSKKK